MRLIIQTGQGVPLNSQPHLLARFTQVVNSDSEAAWLTRDRTGGVDFSPLRGLGVPDEEISSVLTPFGRESA
jgi:hypothetical protein